MIGFLRKKSIYTPRAGWGFFTFRIVVANSILAVFLWIAAGDLQWWLNAHWTVRIGHLLWLALTAIFIYCASLWLAGIRPKDVLIPQREAII